MLPSLRTCLHVGGGPQIGEVTCGRSPHLSCTHDQIKMRYYLDRRVMSHSWVPPTYSHLNRPLDNNANWKISHFSAHYFYLHVTLSFSFICNWNDNYVHASPYSLEKHSWKSKCIPVVRPKWRKNYTFLGSTYLLGNYIRECPPRVKAYISLLLLSNWQLNMQSA